MFILELQVQKQLDRGEIILSTKPVWFNTFQRDDFLEQMIGVQFLDNDIQTETINSLKEL